MLKQTNSEMSDASNTVGSQSTPCTAANVQSTPHTDAAPTSSTSSPIMEGKALSETGTATDGPAAEHAAAPGKKTPEKMPHLKHGPTPTARVLDMMHNMLQVQEKHADSNEQCAEQ